VAYARYDGMATTPRSVRITTEIGQELYLPLVMR
jgi:hypothetical protein